MAVVLPQMGIVCALGADADTVWQQALTANQESLSWQTGFLSEDKTLALGAVKDEWLVSLQEIPATMRTRNNQLAATAYAQIAGAVTELRGNLPPERIGVVIGTSTSGVAEGERAQTQLTQSGEFPPEFSYKMQEMLAPAAFIAHLAQVTGPTYSISTACSSSARALMSARSLLQANLVDAVIVGGVDSLCRLTINGFHALESTSAGRCQPFSANRDGISIGEAAALFVMTRSSEATSDCVALLGGSGSSDAHHMSAPDPTGKGAAKAIQQACQQAGIAPADLDYINLHGTGTPLNDSMEAAALHQLGAAKVPASSTKGMTGHTLGAAGALEAALCWLTLSPANTDKRLLPQAWDGVVDTTIEPVALVAKQQQAERLNTCLSNSFAFGGNNVALVLGRVKS